MQVRAVTCAVQYCSTKISQGIWWKYLDNIYLAIAERLAIVRFNITQGPTSSTPTSPNDLNDSISKAANHCQNTYTSETDDEPITVGPLSSLFPS